MTPSVLLIAPGAPTSGENSFGDPHLVGLGSFLQTQAGAEVEIIDLGYERFLPAPAPERIFAPRYHIIGLSCYSSYDYLKVFHLGLEIRRRNPKAILVVGGYHPSARPEDFLNLPGSPLEEPSPFNYVVVGEGELPMLKIVRSITSNSTRQYGVRRHDGALAFAQSARTLAEAKAPSCSRTPKYFMTPDVRCGERAISSESPLLPQVLGPEPVPDLDALPPLNWALLNRYQSVARNISDEVTIHLSRGCPFQCSFCMERAKGEACWRAWSPARAEQELLSLHRWLNLKDWKLFIADALFGLNYPWQEEMLDRLARLRLGLAATWTLVRLDRVQHLEKFKRANVGIGFGLESGDPTILRLTNKTAQPEAFYEQCQDLARQAALLQLPWGANIITGHPGETEASLENSSRFIEKLFCGTKGLTGFLSIDPFRYYPGSPIDRQLSFYAQRFGTRVHRPRWWNYSDQAFCSEWVDPSAQLDYHHKEALAARLFEPIVQKIVRRFSYHGPAHDYYRRSVASAVAVLAPAVRLRTLHDYHLWKRLTGQNGGGLTADPVARDLFRKAREQTWAEVAQMSGRVPKPIRQALLQVPREQYVPPQNILESWQDTTIPLTEDGASNVSALHAYAINFTRLALRKGDRLLDLGGGTGYGAAVAAAIVGPKGHVTTVEYVPELAAMARRNLSGQAHVELLQGDALRLMIQLSTNKILFSFCLKRIPQKFLDALPEGGRLLAPLLQGSGEQILALFTRHNGRVVVKKYGPVLYGPIRR